jgi:hypothetical protein
LLGQIIGVFSLSFFSQLYGRVLKEESLCGGSHSSLGDYIYTIFQNCNKNPICIANMIVNDIAFINNKKNLNKFKLN